MARFRITRITTFSILAVFASASLFANGGYNPADFQEDENATQSENMEWPEAEFAEASERGRAFKAGETFKFRAQWGLFKRAGTMHIETDKAKGDRGVWRFLVKTSVQSRGLIRKIFPIKLKAKTVIDTSEWRMVTNETNIEERAKATDSETVFDYDKGVMVHTDVENPTRDATREIPYPYALDYSSSLLQTRGWDLESEDEFPLLVSSKGKFYFVKMEVKETETINTSFGQMEAYRIEPTTSYPKSKLFREGGKFAIWISTDEKRIPLRIDVRTGIGTASMRLTEYTSGDIKLIASVEDPENSAALGFQPRSDKVD